MCWLKRPVRCVSRVHQCDGVLESRGAVCGVSPLAAARHNVVLLVMVRAETSGEQRSLSASLLLEAVRQCSLVIDLVVTTSSSQNLCSGNQCSKSSHAVLATESIVHNSGSNFMTVIMMT